MFTARPRHLRILVGGLAIAAGGVIALSSSGFAERGAPHPRSALTLSAVAIGAAAATASDLAAARPASRRIGRTSPAASDKPLDQNALIIYLLMQSARPQPVLGR
jgi:hypothetical protein